MKKIYKAPLTKVVKINAEKMICDSYIKSYTGTPDVKLSKDNDYDEEDDLW